MTGFCLIYQRLGTILELTSVKLPGYKIRASQTQKIPYQIVVGDKEVEEGTVNIRRYGSKETHVELLDMFIDAMVADVKNYSRK